MVRAFTLGLVVFLAAPFSASAATWNAAVPAIPAEPIAIHISPIVSVAPAALSANLPEPFALSQSLLPTSPALAAVPAPLLPAAATETLARLPAAAEGIDPTAAVPAEPERGTVSEKDAANAGAQFDGTAPADPAAPATPPPANVAPAAPLGSGLRMARAEHDEWLASVVAALKGTRTGRRVLRDIDALAASRGVPTLLDIAAIGNNGEFRYNSNLLVMDAGHYKRDPLQSAPILAHELQHVLQRAMNLPTDALELEIESYTVENRVWSELGVEPDAGTFARDVRVRIMKDADKFFKWLPRTYKNDVALHGKTMDSYIAELRKKLAASERTSVKTRRKRAAVVRVLASMKEYGLSDAAIEAHRHESLEPLDRSLRDGAETRGWLERDLLMLSRPEERARFRAYARGVISRARALSRS